MDAEFSAKLSIGGLVTWLKVLGGRKWLSAATVRQNLRTACRRPIEPASFASSATGGGFDSRSSGWCSRCHLTAAQFVRRKTAPFPRLAKSACPALGSCRPIRKGASTRRAIVLDLVAPNILPFFDIDRQATDRGQARLCVLRHSPSVLRHHAPSEPAISMRQPVTTNASGRRPLRVRPAQTAGRQSFGQRWRDHPQAPFTEFCSLGIMSRHA